MMASLHMLNHGLMYVARQPSKLIYITKSIFRPGREHNLCMLSLHLGFVMVASRYVVDARQVHDLNVVNSLL